MFTLKEFLKNEVKPALGCTEPGAVALAVARACKELSDRGEIASVRVTVSGSIYKNGMAVGIPGTRGARGNAMAAAMGAICGDSDLGLEVLRNSTKDDVAKAERWVTEERVSIYCDPDRSGVYVLASVFTPENKAVCLIEGSHSNIVKVVLNGETITDNAPEKTSDAPSSGFANDGFPEKLFDALKLVEQIDDEDADFLFEGVEMNMKVAEGGYRSAEECVECGECVQGSRFGRTLLEFAEPGEKDCIALKVRSICAAAADARMSGILLPVMSSAGSGNHGITAILPVAVFGEYFNNTRREIARALAISHIATSFVKRRLGRMSPVCGCSIAAGAGAAAGLTSLMGGDEHQIANAMELLLANLAGMLCDGAKESCALKVSSASAEAYYSARWAMSGQRLRVAQGVFGDNVEETAENVGKISNDGMKTVDRVMIGILDQRHRPGAEAF